ncbi:MAG: acyl-CoA dehydrogenase family protein [Acidimicrobiales bacterium]
MRVLHPSPFGRRTALTDEVHDVLAPEGGGGAAEGSASARPVAAARSLAAELLAPAAEATDRAAIVPPDHLRALARAGLCGLFCPPTASLAATREIFEVLAGACGVTFFVWVQHHAPVRMLAGSPNEALRRRHLDDLCTGRVLGGVAFAYLRRPGPAAVVARPVAGGYVIDGEAPWVTSWGLAGLYSVAARLGDEVIYVVVEGAQSEALRPSAPLALAAMGASSTVRLSFDDLFVPDHDVLRVMSFDEWRSRDRVATAQPNPAAFGIAATCVRLLGDTPLAEELAECRERSYALADAGLTDGAHLAAQVEARAQSLALAVRAATALVVATGGRGMSSGHPAQRLLREAAFFTIQAQTPELRRATLAQLGSRTS